MTILQINKFHYLNGGADGYYLAVSRLLTEKGHSVIPFTMNSLNLPADPWRRYFVSPVDLSRPRFSWRFIKGLGRLFWSPEAARKIKKLIYAAKPQVAHLHSIYHHLSPSILPVLKAQGLRTVMTVHDWHLVACNYNLFHRGRVCTCVNGSYWPVIRNKCVKDSYLASLLEVAEQKVHRFLRVYEKYIDVLIAPSEIVKKKLLANSWPENKVRVLPHFVDIKIPSQGVRKPGDYLLYIGRLSQEKGVDKLIRAYSRTQKLLPLLIAGDGVWRAELEDLTAKLGLCQDIRFLGKKKIKDIAELISCSRALVLPAQSPETFGLVVLEAYLLEKAVIASRIGALPEVVKDRETGFLFPPQDIDALAEKLELISNQPALAVKYGLAGAKLVKDYYNKEKHYQELIKIYEDK